MLITFDITSSFIAQQDGCDQNQEDSVNSCLGRIEADHRRDSSTLTHFLFAFARCERDLTVHLYWRESEWESGVASRWDHGIQFNVHIGQRQRSKKNSPFLSVNDEPQ